MPLYCDPDTTLESRPTGSPSAHSRAGEELDNARQADAAWRAQRRDWFTLRLRQIQWLTGPLERAFDLGASVAALVVFVGPVVVPLLHRRSQGSPSHFPEWALPVWAGGGCCFVLLTIAAFAIRLLTWHVECRLRDQAVAEEVELADTRGIAGISVPASVRGVIGE